MERADYSLKEPYNPYQEICVNKSSGLTLKERLAQISTKKWFNPDVRFEYNESLQSFTVFSGSEYKAKIGLKRVEQNTLEKLIPLFDNKTAYDIFEMPGNKDLPSTKPPGKDQLKKELDLKTQSNLERLQALVGRVAALEEGQGDQQSKMEISTTTSPFTNPSSLPQEGQQPVKLERSASMSKLPSTPKDSDGLKRLPSHEDLHSRSGTIEREKPSSPPKPSGTSSQPGGSTGPNNTSAKEGTKGRSFVVPGTAALLLGMTVFVAWKKRASLFPIRNAWQPRVK